MKTERAEIQLQWDDGKIAKLGTIEITVGLKGTVVEIKGKSCRWIRQRMALELIRKGIWMMLHKPREG